jgi:hypothetical protein
MTAGRFAILCAMVSVVAGCAVFRAPEREAPEPPAEPTPSEAEAPEPPEAPQPPLAVEPVRAPETELDRLLNYFQHLKRLAGAELGREHENVRAAFGRTRGDFDRVRLAMVLSMPNTPFNDDARVLELLEPMMKNENSQLRGLAVLMGTYVHEQRRLGASVQGLQQKLNALKSMERSLIEREQGGQKRR